MNVTLLARMPDATLPRHLIAAITLLFGTVSMGSGIAAEKEPCGETGVWLQILGAGGPEIDDGRVSSSYLVWIENKARLLVDTAPGTSAHFDEVDANFADLDAIVLTQLHADHSADFPAFIHGSRFVERQRPLAVLGPDGNDGLPDTKTFVQRLIGPNGAYPHLADMLVRRPVGRPQDSAAPLQDARSNYRLTAWNVPARGRQRWAGYASDHFRLSAMPVHHGDVPALAWRMDTADKAIVFAGEFSNRKDLIAGFAKNADALVVAHSVPETARADAQELFALPSKLGKVAERAEARILVLGHRTNVTRGRESQSREAMAAHFTGPIIFADDLECWGL